ncbi:hypothetical protein RRG08_042934 [Elysia crispata]|uniref:Uncharacterized protein n=1 Tax=Elysia crispata TaxID=231223 RepID=A0AAE1AUA1_9GAST|nr:hypothetical protein RRG08_042934 [Elysia crispata]
MEEEKKMTAEKVTGQGVSSIRSGPFPSFIAAVISGGFCPGLNGSLYDGKIAELSSLLELNEELATARCLSEHASLQGSVTPIAIYTDRIHCSSKYRAQKMTFNVRGTKAKKLLKEIAVRPHQINQGPAREHAPMDIPFAPVP